MLAAQDLLIVQELPSDYEGGVESEDADTEWSEEFVAEEPHLALTALGWKQVALWLHGVEPLFRGWPPDRPDVDDAVE